MDGTVACIVLAGGGSRRMGADKRLVPVEGAPMLVRTIGRLAPWPMLVVIDPSDPPGLILPTGVRVVPDTRPGEGPLAALEAGLRASTASTVLVVGGDMPWVQAAVLASLADRLRASTQPTVACLHDGDRPRPLPLALARTATLARLTPLLDAGERRLRALLSGAVVVPLPEWRPLDPEMATLRDVDTPADLVAIP